MPHLVREMRVGRDDVNLGLQLLERRIVVGRILDLGRAVEGEGSGHEHQDRPLAFQVGFGDFDELAILERLDLEGLDLGIDDGH